MKALTVLLLFGLIIKCNGSSYVPIKLNQGLQVSLPSNWMIMNHDMNVLIESFVEANLGKNYIDSPASNSRLFMAGYIFKGVKPYSNAVNFNVRFYEEDLGLSQSDVKSLSTYDLQDLDSSLKTEIERAASISKFKILKWYGTKNKIVSGKYFIMTQYLRSGINKSRKSNEDFMVTLLRYIDKGKYFTITISYRQSLKDLVDPICGHVIKTIRVN